MHYINRKLVKKQNISRAFRKTDTKITARSLLAMSKQNQNLVEGRGLDTAIIMLIFAIFRFIYNIIVP